MPAIERIVSIFLIVVFFYLLSNLFELTMLSWLIDKLLISGIIFIAIVFQPELRRSLDHLGRQRIVGDEEDEMYDELVQAFAKEEGCTEQLKATNQMLWVRKMNNAAQRAREVVNTELIYN